MNNGIKVVAIFCFTVFCANAAELTPEQCKAHKYDSILRLSDSQKNELEEKCKSKYSDERVYSNCVYFESEKLRDYLKAKAASECK